MATVLIPLAPGFEELEAVTVIDLLRRANIEVTTAGLRSGPVTASRHCMIVPDTTLDEVGDKLFDLVVLPGGAVGAELLGQDPRIASILRNHDTKDRLIAAICAAPTVLAAAGLLVGKRVTGYPGFVDQHDVKGMRYSGDAVEVDGRIITSRGPGTAMDFALTLIEALIDRNKRDEVEAGLKR